MKRLSTPRLRLEPFVVAHAEAMFDLLVEPSLHRDLPTVTPAEAGARFPTVTIE